MLGAKFQLSAYDGKHKHLESRIYLITRESYDDISTESQKLLKDFLEDMKKVYQDKKKPLFCELAIEDGSVGGGGYHWKLLQTLEEEI